MPLFTWKPEFSVSVASIDSQHKRLVDLINKLYDAMKAGSAKDSLGQILSELIGYTATHFTYEERVMREQGYPDFARHKKEHEALVAKVNELQSGFRGGSQLVTIETMNFLRDWLQKHILTVDKAYTAHLTARGVK